MKIKITRNCASGEHTFIPALTRTDGHEHIVTSFVCQHCLFYVFEEVWYEHIKENFSNEPKVTTEPLPDAGTSPANTEQTKERKKKSKTKEHNGLEATKEIS